MNFEFSKIELPSEPKESKPESKPKNWRNPVMEEELTKFLIKEIHEKKGKENPQEGISRKELLEEGVKAGVLKEREKKKEEKKGEERKEKKRLPRIAIKKIDLEKMKEGEIIEGRWKVPVKEGSIDEEGRPSALLFINEQFVVIKLPKFSEEIIQKIIKKKERIPVRYFEVKIDKRRKKYLVSQFDVLRKDRGKGKITREIINERIKEYIKFIEPHIKEGKITKEEAEREILSFMVPGGKLAEWERKIKEDLELKEEFKLRNESIKDFILDLKKI